MRVCEGGEETHEAIVKRREEKNNLMDGVS